MSPSALTCREIEPGLAAVAAGEPRPGEARAVERHVAICESCREKLGRYRALEDMVSDLRRAPLPGVDPALSRAELESRLADIRTRTVAYATFSSPLGTLLIGRSELGVSLVQYLGSPGGARARLRLLGAVDAVEDRPALEGTYRELLDYLEGRRTRIEWPLDLRFARSDFQRRVLDVTAALPYGAVASYAGIAKRIGEPSAARAVAQALRWNPVPIVIPCHRVIGSTGDLTGYAGSKVGLKERLLSLEGVPVPPHAGRIDRSHMYAVVQGEREYCVPTCGSLASMPLAELTLFGSRERAEAARLTPCTSCRPDLHPLPA